MKARGFALFLLFKRCVCVCSVCVGRGGEGTNTGLDYWTDIFLVFKHVLVG